MPWRECRKMDERLRFVARLLDGEKMAVLCREFDISRKTGYKIFNRYKDCGVEGLTDRSPPTLPACPPIALPDRGADPAAQARSTRAGVLRRSARRSAVCTLGISCRPSAPCMRSSIGTVWSSRRPPASLQGRRHQLSRPDSPNDLWCADYKGEFMLADKRYCYPLTITDFASRYLLCCEALETTKEQLRLYRV